MNFYNDPAVGNNFFAREDILEALLKSARDIRQGYRHNIAIIGRGLIGKSSLLLHFLGITKDENDLIPVYINLKGIGFTEFADNFINNVLYYSLRRIKRLKKGDDAAYLYNSARKLFPKTADLIKRVKLLIESGNFDDAYSAILDIGVVINSETGWFPLIVLDEFDRVTSFPIKRPFQILGQKIMVQQKTLFILSSSSTVTARKILSERLSMLFGSFKVMDIEPFNPQEARRFIQQQCKDIFIPDDLRDFLITFTGGHPFYLASIVKRLNLAKQCGLERLSSKDMSILLAGLLFEPSGVINQFFTDILENVRGGIAEKGAFDILKILVGTVRRSEISDSCKLAPSQINNVLSSLLEMGIVSKSGSLHTVTDTAFRVWVEVKSRTRNLCFDFIPDADASAYIKELEEIIFKFKADSKRRFDEKIVELATSFKNDSFLIDQRVRILPPLSYVKQERMGSGTVLAIMQGRKEWLFVVPNNRIREEDVYNILNKINELKYNDARVVLISAFDIDEPARLLAKQKHLWVWGREDINRLFVFFKGYGAIIA